MRFVGHALAIDLRQRLALGIHTDVTVPAEHLPAHVAGDLHDRLVAGAALCQFRDQRVPVIVPASFDASLVPNNIPGGLQRGGGCGGVGREPDAYGPPPIGSFSLDWALAHLLQVQVRPLRRCLMESIVCKLRCHPISGFVQNCS